MAMLAMIVMMTITMNIKTLAKKQMEAFGVGTLGSNVFCQIRVFVEGCILLLFMIIHELKQILAQKKFLTLCLTLSKT